MRKKRMMQRVLSLMLACLMMVSAPLSALAEEGLLAAEETQLLAEESLTDEKSGEGADEEALLDGMKDSTGTEVGSSGTEDGFLVTETGSSGTKVGPSGTETGSSEADSGFSVEEIEILDESGDETGMLQETEKTGGAEAALVSEESEEETEDCTETFSGEPQTEIAGMTADLSGEMTEVPVEEALADELTAAADESGDASEVKTKTVTLWAVMRDADTSAENGIAYTTVIEPVTVTVYEGVQLRYLLDDLTGTATTYTNSGTYDGRLITIYGKSKYGSSDQYTYSGRLRGFTKSADGTVEGYMNVRDREISDGDTIILTTSVGSATTESYDIFPEDLSWDLSAEDNKADLTVDEDTAQAIFDQIDILNENASLDEVTEKLSLSTKVTVDEKAYRISWKSSDTAVVSNAGTVTRSRDGEDKTVTLTASVCDGPSRTYLVTVKAYDEDQTAVLNVRDLLRSSGTTLDWAYIQGENSRGKLYITSDLYLPASLEEYPGVFITWKSSTPDSIASDGKVTRQDNSGEDVSSITLTAVIAKGAYSETLSVTGLKVLKITSYEVNLDKDVAWLQETWAPQWNLSALTTEPDLPGTGEPGGTTISWSTSDETVIAADGRIFRGEIGGETKTATLTATLKSSVYTRTVEFPVSVLPWTEEGKTLLQEKKDALTNLLDSVGLPDYVNSGNQKAVTVLMRDCREQVEAAYDEARAAGATVQELEALEQYANYLSIQATLRKLAKTVTVSIINVTKNDDGTYTSGGYYLEKTRVTIAGDTDGADANDVRSVLYGLYSSGAISGTVTSSALVLKMADGTSINAATINTATGGSYAWRYAVNGVEKGVYSGVNSATHQTLEHGDNLVFYFTEPDDTRFLEGDYAQGLPDDTDAEYDYANAEIYDANWLTYGVILNENSSRYAVTTDLALPTKGKCASKIAWASDRTDVITAKGVVTQQESDVSVTLTATVGTGTKQQTRKFVLTVKAAELSMEKKTLQYALEQLELEGLDAVTENIVLPSTGFKGAAVSWESGNSDAISSDGTVTRGEEDQTVTLTATVTVGEESGTKEFTATVLKKAETDAEKLAYDKAALTFEAICGENTSADEIQKDLVLPSLGAMGSTITWESSDKERISSSGTVSRGETAAPVTLTAYLENGGETGTVVFNLTVSAPTQQEEARIKAEQVIAGLPDAATVSVESREQVEAALQEAQAAVDAAVDAGNEEAAIDGLEKLEELKTKLENLPVTMTFSIMGADVENGQIVRDRWLVEPCKLLVPAGSNISDITEAVIKNYAYVRPGSGVGYYASFFGLGQFDAGKGSGWIYAGVGEGLNTSVGCQGSIATEGCVVYWKFVGDTADDYTPDYPNLSEALPADHPIDKNLVPPTDLEELKTLLASVSGLDKESYRNYGPWAGAWEEMLEAAEKAQKIVDAADTALDYEIDDAVTTLSAAISRLQPNDPDKTGLQALVDEASALNEEDYYPSGWEDLQALLDASREVLADEYAETSMISQMEELLREAIDGLLPRSQADKTSLKDTLDYSDQYIRENYSLQKWEALQTAKAAAEQVMEDENATDAEIAEAAAALKTAMGSLTALTMTGVAGNQVVYKAAEDWQGTSEAWNVFDMALMGRADEVNEDGYLMDVASLLEEGKASATDLERTVIVLTSLGYDVRSVQLADGTQVDLIEQFKNLLDPQEDAVNAILWALTAIDSGNYGEEEYKEVLKERLLELQNEDGGWPLYPGGESDLDITAMVVIALSAYSNETAVDTALRNAFGLFEANISQLTGTPNTYKGNSNTTAMVWLAYMAAPSYDKAGYMSYFASGGLWHYVTEEYQLGYTDGVTYNALATEQGVRAYTAYSYFTDNNNAAMNVYRFDSPTKSLSLPKVDEPVIETDLTNCTTDQTSISFRASGSTSDGEAAAISVFVNGSRITEEDGMFTAPLAAGSNIILIQALGWNNALTEKTYSVIYSQETGGKKITVSFSLYGDSNHGYSPHVQYEEWIPSMTREIPAGSTARYLTETVLNEKGIVFDTDGTYVSGIGGLYEFDNGRNSGWMYTVNGVIVNKGYNDWILEDGDVVQWFYTDDYTVETGIRPEEAAAHSCTWDTGVVTKAATCTEPGVTTYTCTGCGAVRTEEIPAAGHSFGEWTTAAAATVSAAETQQRTCTVCGLAETRTVGEPLTPVLEVPGELNSFNIKNKTTVKFAVTMAEGDSVVSVKSVNPKKVQVKSFNADGSVTLKAKKKGTAKITVTLASGKTRTYKVKSTPKVVKTKKITGVAKTLTLKKGGSVKLNPVLVPFTSTQKLTYASSNKKVAKVSAKGKITAAAAGTATITVKSGAKSVKCKVTVK